MNIDKIIKEYQEWITIKPSLTYEIDDFGKLEIDPENEEISIVKYNSALIDDGIEIKIDFERLKTIFNILSELFKDETE